MDLHTALEFQHAPLRDPSHQIRLLEIDDVDPLTFKISDWPLHSAPKFIAISYVWGNPTACKTISINAMRVEITSNAEEALQQTYIGAKSTNIRFIWLDSVCIDQTSLSEKGCQVSMMGEIYGAAYAVYACIGGDADGAVALIKNTPQLHQIAVPFDEETIKAARGVLERPYWSRLWIVQELARAENAPVVLCGSAASGVAALMNVMNRSGIRFKDTVVEAVMSLGTTDWDAPGGHLVRRRRPKSVDLPGEPTGKRPFNSDGLGNLLRACWPLGCVDPRDRIFGLLGMIEPRTSGETLKVDYNSTRLELACRALPFLGPKGKIGMDDVLNLLAALHYNLIAPWGGFYLFWDYKPQGPFITLIEEIGVARHEAKDACMAQGAYMVNVRALRIVNTTGDLSTSTRRCLSLVRDSSRPSNKDSKAHLYWRGIHVADVDASIESGDYLLLGRDHNTASPFAFVVRYNAAERYCGFLSTASTQGLLDQETLIALEAHADQQWKLDALSFLTLGAVTLWSRHLAPCGEFARGPQSTSTDVSPPLPPLLTRAESTYASRYDYNSAILFARLYYNVPLSSDKIFSAFHSLIADQNFRKISTFEI